MRRRLRDIAVVPTLVTLGNLFCGFLAIAYCADSVTTADPVLRFHLWEKAVIAIFVAMIFDALDGKVARLTNQATEFGSQLDSLSDVVSFGAAPALLFKVMVESQGSIVEPKLSLVIAGLYLACVGLRLARFNVETDDEDSHEYFKGMPSPAGAAMVVSAAYLAIEQLGSRQEAQAALTLRILTIVMPMVGLVMVSRIPYVHAMNFLFREKRNFTYLVLVVFAAGLLFWKLEIMIPLFCAVYLLSGPVLYVVDLLLGRERVDGESIL